MIVFSLNIFTVISTWLLLYLLYIVTDVTGQNSTVHFHNMKNTAIPSTINTTISTVKTTITQSNSIKNNNFDINPTPAAQSENPYVNTPGKHFKI